MKLRSLFLGLSLTGLFALATPLSAAPAVSTPVDCAAVEAAQFFSPDNQEGQFLYEDLAEALRGMGETPLWCDGADEVYRFLYSGNYGDKTLVRVSRTGEQRFISVKSLDAKGRMTQRFNRRFSKREWRNAVTLIEGRDFWSLPTDRDSDFVMIDGWTWLAEGRRGTTYHFAFRWIDEDRLSEVGEKLIAMSGAEE